MEDLTKCRRSERGGDAVAVTWRPAGSSCCLSWRLRGVSVRHVGVQAERHERGVAESLSWMRVAFVGFLYCAFCEVF